MDIDAWRLAVDAAPITLSIAAMVYAHWRTQTRATQADIDALKREAQALRDRLTLSESRLNDTPTSKALHELALAIKDMGGDLKATVARLKGLENIVNRLDRITDRQESYLLDKGGSR